MQKKGSPPLDRKCSIVLKFICNSKTVTIRSFWQENGHRFLNNGCFNIYINILIIFCIIHGAKVTKNYLKVFSIFWWRKAREMLGLQFCGLTGLVLLESNLLKYPHKLEIEGEIALLSLYCYNCYTAHHRRTYREKRLFISRKKNN